MKRSIVAGVAIFALSVVSVPFVVVAQQPVGVGQSRSSDESVRGISGEKRERVDEIRDTKREEIQEKVAQRQAQIKASVCERRQEQLQRRIFQLASQSNRLLGVIDSTYERVDTFYETNQLTVQNYDVLSERVQAAQEEAYGAVESVASYEFDFDCEDTSAGDQTYAFRLSVGEARDSLKAYRAELVALISSMRSAAADESSENEVSDAGAVNDNQTESTQDDDGDEGGQDEE